MCPDDPGYRATKASPDMPPKNGDKGRTPVYKQLKEKIATHDNHALPRKVMPKKK